MKLKKLHIFTIILVFVFSLIYGVDLSFSTDNTIVNEETNNQSEKENNINNDNSTKDTESKDEESSDNENKILEITYRVNVAKDGWQDWKNNGKIAGTTGQNKKLKAINIKLLNNSENINLKYQAHIEDIGWQDWKNEGELAGTEDDKRIEAIKILIDNDSDYLVIYRAHVQDIGWQKWVYNGEIAGTTGLAKQVEAIEIKIIKKSEKNLCIQYNAHVQDVGWQGFKQNGETAGTTGQNKRIEAININLVNNYNNLIIKYQAHIQDIGWQDWKQDGELAGTTGQCKRIEAFKAQIDNNEDYIVMYRVHVQDIGWQNWVYNGEIAGTTGQCKQIEAIEIKIIKKSERNPYIKYQADIGNIGWQQEKNNGETAGTTGQAKKIQAIKINIANNNENFNVLYKAHVSNIGWQDWKNDNAIAGTTDQNLPIEAIRIKLENTSKYSICYRVHVSDIGWLDWVYDGEITGTTGQAKGIEAIEIKIINKYTSNHKLDYGKTGLLYSGNLKGSPLQYYKYGTGPNVFFATFCMHGFEDNWNHDGYELIKIADAFYNRLVSIDDYNLSDKWTIYIMQCVNPDGVVYGTTNNGPGRTTLHSDIGHGIDLNRCWSTGFVPMYSERNYTGSSAFLAPEARYLRDFMLQHKSSTAQNVVVDLHGWTQQLIGDSTIRSYYKTQFSQNSSTDSYGKGYMINWARANLNAKAALIELPTNNHSSSDVVSHGLKNKYINATLSMLRGVGNVSYSRKAVRRNIPNSIEGDSNSVPIDLFETSTEYDGKQIKTVKNSYQYKVALAGIMKNSVPSYSELNNIYNSFSKKSGIWISPNSREKVLQIINDNTNNKFTIDEEGYLVEKETTEQSIKDKNEGKINANTSAKNEKKENENYKKLLEYIHGNNTIVIDINSFDYTIDDVTGEITKYPFEQLDETQTMDVIQNDGNKILVFSSNANNKLTDAEIFSDFISNLK